MQKPAPNESSGNYFALPRLLRRMRGLSAARSESNWIEAYFVGNAIFIISCLFAANFFWQKLSWWQNAIALPLLIAGVWIAWLIILYLHSLVVRVCWAVGLCTDLPRNRVQSVLMGIVTTAFAAQLLASGSWLQWIGAVWIVLVALNLGAALFLALFYEDAQ